MPGRKSDDAITTLHARYEDHGAHKNHCLTTASHSAGPEAAKSGHRFLESHSPKNLEELSKLLIRFRDHYNCPRENHVRAAADLRGSASPDRTAMRSAGGPGPDHPYHLQVYHRGCIFKVSTHLIGEHQLLTTATEITIFSMFDGE
ncbi:hypothetical protein CVS30_16640 [Arthrobacter psychrolactophilus]|uniref:Uncharacterized protein n=1 Tax=Arthrobacter psychrolactophilus TaxID=92442 RepID=A0A2V5IKW2_9MICC|nr:hypothetical protein CVS30_16640 [Arthrobacter psychrolactophilus]